MAHELNSNQDSPSISFNKERYESLQGILKNIYVSYGQRLNLSDVITTNDLLKIEEGKSIDQALVLEAANNAIEQLNEMREREGEIIYADIKNRIEFLEKTLVQS